MNLEQKMKVVLCWAKLTTQQRKQILKNVNENGLLHLSEIQFPGFDKLPPSVCNILDNVPDDELLGVEEVNFQNCEAFWTKTG